MRTSICLSAAAVLTLGLSACGGSGSPVASESPAPVPGSQVPASAGSPSAQSGASSAPASQGSGGDNSGAGGASTPEAAAEAMLHAAGNKNAQAICDMMAIQGKPVNAGGTGPACVQQWTSTLQSTGGALESLKSAKVTNVKTTGDTADLKNATVTPAEGKALLLATPQAQKIGGKWYLVLGSA